MSASNIFALPQRKRRRRRRQDRPPASARLVLDDHIKGDHGILSEDLHNDLFPHLRPVRDDDGAALPPPPSVQYVAIAPWAPSPEIQATTWTVVPVHRSTALAPNTVQFSPQSSALQRFATTLQQVAPSKLSSHSRSGIEILVLDAVALPLDTVFVNLEGGLARRLENGEGTFYRDHPTQAQKGLSAGHTPQERLIAALRVALGTLQVAHSGDLFGLPLPPHPVTHVPPNPGRITLCEPVAQGILTPKTNIIVTRGHTSSGSKHSRVVGSKKLNGVAEEDDAGETTDQFYSAAEEKYKTDTATENETDGMTETESELEHDDHGLEDDEDDEISDDSMEDMISLQTPALPPTAASGVSTIGPGSPMTMTLGGRGRRTNGIATPGSIFSSYTVTTARLDRPKGRLFKAHGLMRPIASELLHPKPPSDDDEEARVYVDVISLTRIGCFSGDWVRLEASGEPPMNSLYSLGPSSFGQVRDEPEPVWRPVKVFGLPEGYSHRPMTRIPSSKHDAGRRPSFFESQVQKPAGPAAYVSPILLWNLENPQYFRLSPLKKMSPLGKPSKVTSASKPPLAKSVGIEKIRTPISLSRECDTAVLAGLKRYFMSSPRVVRTGDVVAVPIDTKLGKSMQEGIGGNGDVLDDLVALTTPSSKMSSQKAVYDEAVWFRIGPMGPMSMPKTESDDEIEEAWSDVGLVDSNATELAQSGSEEARIPGTKHSNWLFYIGLKQPPPSPLSESRVAGPAATKDLALDAQHVSSLRRELRQLLTTATSKRAIALNLPPTAILLVSNQRGVGKARVVSDASADIGLHTFAIDAYDILSDNGQGGGDTNTSATILARVERAMACGAGCTTLLVRHLEALTADRMVGTMKDILSQVRVIVATTTEVDKVPDGVRGLFTHEIEVGAPDEAEREGILKTVVADKGVVLDPEVDLRNVALKTAALVAGDLVDVVERASIAQKARLEGFSESLPRTEEGIPARLRDVQVAGGTSVIGLTNADFNSAVEHARKNFSDAIGAPNIPNVTWDDVGGMSSVKNSIDETIRLPLERPELFARGMKKRSGILFYGPPGTGKTLLAKAIATEYSLNFFSVKGPELLNMYIGESEANVRRVFQRARDARPCVVFFDELDSVAPKRGNQGDSGGVMDRIVSQLLAELDGMSGGDGEGGGVFVIGATNRPDLLDPALLRPGRFDKMLYLGVADTRDKQTTIMEALTRKFTLDPSVSLANIASSLPFTYTGADFYALCSDAMLKAVTRQASQVDAKIKRANAERERHNDALPPGAGRQALLPISTAYFFDHFATKEDVAVMVSEEDFSRANDELVPSVSAGELGHYEMVRMQFEGDGKKEKKTKKGEGQGRGGRELGGGGEENGAQTIGEMLGAGGGKTAVGLGTGVSMPGRGVESGNGNGNGAGTGNGRRVPSSSWKKRRDAKGKGKAVEDDGYAYDDEFGAFGVGSSGGTGSDGSVVRHTTGGKGRGKGKGKAVDGGETGFGDSDGEQEEEGAF
ncbi:AAA-domain-containing protein [Zalerion maritima]|uniref:Peroxisomal ATPase PEX6 n=1 Tax=Zalerion maritima TaxID=339359 RepID=A0AAD5RUK9_9PEZI|nr:AAA-domain-containing protein [Zalerion maritima]